MEGVIYYPSYTLEREISNFIKVWISVVVSLCYCYFSAKFVPKGMPRLFSIIPIVSLFFALPLKLHSTNLGGNTAFFIAWLTNFKLLLFAFDKGPLSHPSLSLPHFIAIACFPIRIQQNPPTKSQSNLTKNQNEKNPPTKLISQNGLNRQNSYLKTTGNGCKSIWNYALKVVLVGLFLRIYEYSDRMHLKIVLVIYCLHIYITLEIMLAMGAAVARGVFGFELEPPFDEPYLSTSLQDFWGRRWNLVVSRTLRPTVYDPILCISARLMGRKWAALPAVMSTFVVSGLMHELMFYYMGRVRPTWEITWFFLLHGACLVVEIGIKKVVNGRFWLPRVIATPMTVGFVMVTGFWLFFPQFLRCKADVRGLEEYALVGAFVKDVVAGVKLGNFSPRVQ
ncbi:acyl-CoA--sterol O-acyltransferase 1-like [Rhododendron vialii]|uniref:acyl-CoA--sterol O-acyltransferase 1-like n=1 Tax=Rhododendron vialii TaxID=182163 RepID=UPI00265F8D49|nr:acyl-CoA--sterol O-acyltransferase 1-like [Rhododendron vialii]